MVNNTVKADVGNIVYLYRAFRSANFFMPFSIEFYKKQLANFSFKKGSN
jgi:hypothetical protein